jgi:hypothetical protein
MKQIVAGLAIACAVARSAAAQIPALLTESRMIMQIGDNAPDTSIVRTISAGKRHRIESTGHSPALVSPFSGNAAVQILSLADGEMTIDYLDDSAKTYTEMKPLLLMKKAKEMMAAMGAEMKMESTADTATVDSLPDVGVVMGYRTVHFHSLGAHYFRMNVMGHTATLTMRQTSDSYVAPDARKLTAGLTDSLLFSGAGGLMSSLGEAMLPGMDSVMMRAAAKMQRISAAGVPLKFGMEIETTTDGQRQSRMRQAMEVLKLERISVPESTFTVPKNYKKSEFTFPSGPVSGN